MKKIFLFAVLLKIIFFANCFAQSSNNFSLFPSGLNFIPPKANNQEARLGVLYYTSTTNLKVDIGNAVDILSFDFANSASRLTSGIEFMAYAFSKSYAGKRLQISAVDGFFGGNIAFSRLHDNKKLLFRFRIIHNSAHLVDGSYDTSSDSWLDDRKPIPFTKDFGELTAAHQIYFEDFILKYYGGISYAALIRPNELKRFNYHFGLESAFPNIISKVFEKEVNLFLAEHFFIDGTEKYFGSQQLIAGVKFGSWESKGVVFYASYYTGRNMFSSFYDRKISRFGIGFFVDFY